MPEPLLRDPDPARQDVPVRPTATPLLARAALLALLWFVLSGGALSSWVVGLPAIAAALLLVRLLRGRSAPWRLDAAGVLRFAAYFVRESARGGIDVALRVSAPVPRVAPGLLRHRCRLPAGSPARTLFVLCVSLLPGTLVAAVDEHGLLIHALDTGAPVADELAVLEQRVAGLFGLRLPAPEAAGG